MARVLTTSAEKGSGIGAIQALQKTSHEIVAVSTDPQGAGLYLADIGEIVPPVEDDRWPRSIAEIVSERDVDVVLPLNDEDLEEIDRLHAALPDDVPTVLPRSDVVERMLDKKQTYEWLEREGVEIPETDVLSEVDVDDLDPDLFPRIVKPRQGSRARGVEIVHSVDDVRAYVESSPYEPHQLLFQQYIDGIDYTSNLAVTTDNRLLSVVMKEVLDRQGYARWAATRSNDRVREACRDVFEVLKPEGPINVQHMVDDSGKPYLIEVNPRFSGSSCLNAEAGVNEYDLLIRDACGETVDPVDSYETGLNLIRYHDRLYVSDDELLSEDGAVPTDGPSPTGN